MKKGTEFKFSPPVIGILSLITFYFIYTGLSSVAEPLISWENFAICLVPMAFSFISLPIAFKLIFNIPAIVLTDDCLKNNSRGYSIEWDDIAGIELYTSKNGRSFTKLIVNLKDPDKYFDTPLKKIYYKFSQLFVVNDISIWVDFIAGDNNDISDTIKAYWTRNFEH